MFDRYKHPFAAFMLSILVIFISFVFAQHYTQHIKFTKAQIDGTMLLPLTKKLLFQTQHLTHNQDHTTINQITTTLAKLQNNKHATQFTNTQKYILLLKQNFDQVFHHDLNKSIDKQQIKKIFSLEEQLILTIANESNLILDPNIQTYYLMDSVINTIPKMIITLASVELKDQQTLLHSLTQLYTLFVDTQNELFISLDYILAFNPELKHTLQDNYYEVKKELTTLKMQLYKHNFSTTQEFFKFYQYHQHRILILLSNLYNINTSLLFKALQTRLNNYKMQKSYVVILAILFLLILIYLTYTVTQNQKAAKQNKYLAYHDQLTTLYNKYALDRDLKTLNPTAALLIDIKQFSSVNDLYGEAIGDQVLQDFAQTLVDINKTFKCRIYRVASDQFMVLNLHPEELISCHRFAKKLFKHCDTKSIELLNNQQPITISLKIRIAKVLINTDISHEKHHCKTRADMALNYAKKKHKDFITYSHKLKLEEKLHDELQKVTLVRDAILEKRVIPVFQKITKRSGDSYETLMRIKQKDGSLLTPANFLESVTHTPYYTQLTKIIIKKSFEYFQHRKEKFSINLSFEDITNKSTITYLIKMIERYNMQGQLIIELLETESMQNITLLKHFIKKMKGYDIEIAIDDFGSGYSNFIYLAQLQPDYIKIDGSIIKNIDTDEKSFTIAKHINDFAKEIGCKTIAEFVHSQAVLNKLHEIDVDGLQGFYLHEPSEKV